jgi:hypothetical protein
MEPTQHTTTIAYSLRVPAVDSRDAHQTADWLRDEAGALGANVTGSHVHDASGVLRFRAADDQSAIGLALALLGTDSKGCTLESGFGVHRRVVAES